MTARGWAAAVAGAAAGLLVPWSVMVTDPDAFAFLVFAGLGAFAVFVGWAFGHRERDVALPTWLGAGVAALFAGIVLPFLFVAVVVIVAVLTGHGPD